MEVDERPTEQYSDIGGLDQQIQEVNTFVNPFTIKISVVFLLTVCHTTLMMLRSENLVLNQQITH